jgi:hypothetical protein
MPPTPLGIAPRGRSFPPAAIVNLAREHVTGPQQYDTYELYRLDRGVLVLLGSEVGSSGVAALMPILVSSPTKPFPGHLSEHQKYCIGHDAVI